MKRNNPFRGLGIAVATPFLPDGTVDFTALRDLIDTQIRHGADFLCILGTTAETPTLSNDEKQQIMQLAVEVNAGRVPLLLGCGSNCTAHVCHYLQTADLTGFDGVLIVAPYYNKPNQEGLYQHFLAVSKASPLPIILYNVPGRTGVNIKPDTVVRIAATCPNVVGIKQANGRLDETGLILQQAPSGFEVLCGDDAVTCQWMTKGVVGVISVIGNALTREFAQQVHTMQNGSFDDQRRVLDDHRLDNIIAYTMTEGNPVGIKAILAAQGRMHNVLRLPLVPAGGHLQKLIKEELAGF